MQSYWAGNLHVRASRRRILAAAGVTSIGASVLIACGKGGSSSPPAGERSLLTKPVDTSKQARRGGTFKFYRLNDVVNFDPDVEDTTAINATGRAYSKLLQVKPGYLGPPPFEISPALVESWEWSGDGLTLSMKLRQDAGFAPIPPAHGRQLDMADVALAFKR